MPHDPIFLEIEVKGNDTEDSFETNLHCSRADCGEIVNIDSDGPKTIQRVSDRSVIHTDPVVDPNASLLPDSSTSRPWRYTRS